MKEFNVSLGMFVGRCKGCGKSVGYVNCDDGRFCGFCPDCLKKLDIFVKGLKNESSTD